MAAGQWELPMRSELGIVVLGPALAGCASSSADVAPAYVSPVAYQSYNCQQLALEAQAVSTRAATLSGAQDSQRSKDQIVTGSRSSCSGPQHFSFKVTNKTPPSSR
jgi:hypothetical protein